MNLTKVFLIVISVMGVSLGGSLAANHFPLNLALTIPSALLVGYAACLPNEKSKAAV